MRPQFELQGKNIGVLGFNARPIACSAKRAGAFTYASDYWGDTDLDSCCTDWIAVLTPEPHERQRGTLDAPVYESLSKNLLETFSHIELDSVLVGSGFDDHPEYIADISKKWKIAGNPPEKMKAARDLQALDALCDDFSITRPQTIDIETVEEGVSVAKNIGYPILVRKRTSGGGSGIHFFSDEFTLENHLSTRLEKGQKLRIQEYVRGLDYSCSVLSTGNDAFALSVQSQLIGIPSAGRNCDFVYCGNYLPIQLDSKIEEKISTFSKEVCNNLGLVGSNGVDFLVSEDNDVFLLEVNPRLQGTLEMLEMSGDISVVQHHYDALNGILPNKKPRFRPIVKMILYAAKTGLVPDLSTFSNTYDRTPEGLRVFKGDPICTIIETGTDLSKCYQKITQIAYSIQAGLY